MLDSTSCSCAIGARRWPPDRVNKQPQALIAKLSKMRTPLTMAGPEAFFTEFCVFKCIAVIREAQLLGTLPVVIKGLSLLHEVMTIWTDSQKEIMTRVVF